MRDHQSDGATRGLMDGELVRGTRQRRACVGIDSVNQRHRRGTSDTRLVLGERRRGPAALRGRELAMALSRRRARRGARAFRRHILVRRQFRGRTRHGSDLRPFRVFR